MPASLHSPTVRRQTVGFDALSCAACEARSGNSPAILLAAFRTAASLEDDNGVSVMDSALKIQPRERGWRSHGLSSVLHRRDKRRLCH